MDFCRQDEEWNDSRGQPTGVHGCLHRRTVRWSNGVWTQSRYRAQNCRKFQVSILYFFTALFLVGHAVQKCILENLLQTKKGLDSKILGSIGSFLALWCKEETLFMAMERVANLFMERSLKMKTLSSGTLDLEYYPWPTRVQTRTDLNSLFVLKR